MGTCKRQVYNIDDLQKKPHSSFAVGKGIFARRVVYKWMLKHYILGFKKVSPSQTSQPFTTVSR
jgi:hypothetical protein